MKAHSWLQGSKNKEMNWKINSISLIICIYYKTYLIIIVNPLYVSNLIVTLFINYLMWDKTLKETCFKCNISYTLTNKVWQVFEHVQGHWNSKCIIGAGSISFLTEKIWSFHCIEILHMTWHVHMYHDFKLRSIEQIQGHWKKTCLIRVRSILYLMEKHWNFLLHT